MKKLTLLFLAIAFSFSGYSQVQINPFPQAGYDQRIRDSINNMKIVDTHEHLSNQAEYRKSGKLDFMMLLFQYADDNIKSAGMLDPAFNRLMTDSMTVIEKWKDFKPYWEGSSNTAYNRAVLLTADKIFGIKNIDELTVEEISIKK
jgi:hypothetical protein